MKRSWERSQDGTSVWALMPLIHLKGFEKAWMIYWCLHALSSAIMICVWKVKSYESTTSSALQLSNKQCWYSESVEGGNRLHKCGDLGVCNHHRGLMVVDPCSMWRGSLTFSASSTQKDLLGKYKMRPSWIQMQTYCNKLVGFYLSHTGLLVGQKYGRPQVDIWLFTKTWCQMDVVWGYGKGVPLLIMDVYLC